VTNQGPWILIMNLSLGLDRTAMICRSESTVCEVRSVHDVTDNSVIQNIFASFSGASFWAQAGTSRWSRASTRDARLSSPFLCRWGRQCTVCCLYDIPDSALDVSVERIGPDRSRFPSPRSAAVRVRSTPKYPPRLHINMHPSPHGFVLSHSLYTASCGF
jgi:hypothetical protein